MAFSKSLIVSCLLAAGPAFADDAAPAPAPAPTPAPAGGSGTKTIGVDVAGVLPTGDYSDAASFAIGAFGRFEFGINDKLAITGRVGFLYHLGTPDGESIYMIPIYAGAKYSFTPQIFGFGEVGLNHVNISIDIGGVSGSNSFDKLSISAGAGYKINQQISARAGIFYTPGVGDDPATVDLIGVMASVGYDFKTF
jgi:hypothetical protein